MPGVTAVSTAMLGRDAARIMRAGRKLAWDVMSAPVIAGVECYFGISERVSLV
jgi:hypothetical protein